MFWVCFGNFIPSSIWLCWYSCYIKIDPYTPKVNLPESVNQVLKDHEEPKFQMNFRSFIFIIIIIIIYMVCFSCFMKKKPWSNFICIISNPKERLQMLNYGGCTLKTLGVGIVYVEYLFLNSSYSKKKNSLLKS